MLDTIQDTLSDLKALFNNAPDLSIAIRKYLDENAGLKKQVEDFMKEKEAALKERLLKNVQEIHGIKVIKFCSPLPAEVVKNIAFQLRGEITENLFFVAGSTDNGKPMLTVMLSDNLVAGGLKAGNLVKEAAKLIQGGGGGQPHFATAGGKNADGLPAAVEKSTGAGRNLRINKKRLPNKPLKKEITPIRVCSDRGEIVKKRLIDNLFYVKI